jgi:uncharacterized membrane protein
VTPRLRKVALTAHVACSVGWLGAAIAYLALVVAALASGDAPLVRAAYLVIEPLTWFAIVPLALAALVTGLVQALGTRWGVFRHYWVVFKLVLAVVGSIVLLANTRTVAELERAAENDGADAAGLHGQLLHSGGGVLLLLLTTALAVYKPRGMTPYGRRKQRTSPAP